MSLSRLSASAPIVLAVSLLCGCAFTDVRIDLPKRAWLTKQALAKGRPVVVHVPFEDGRKIRDRCGMQKNGYNMDTADALCQQDPAEWIAKQLAAELTLAGFEVLATDAPHEPGTLEIEGSLLKIFIEPVIGMWTGSLEADLDVKLVVSTEDGLRAEREFFVKGIQGGQMVSLPFAYQLALDHATESIMREMVLAIVELTSRFPTDSAAPTDAAAASGDPR